MTLKKIHSKLAYGEYNDTVLEVAGNHGQTVAMWDFEYALLFICVFFFASPLASQ